MRGGAILDVLRIPALCPLTTSIDNSPTIRDVNVFVSYRREDASVARRIVEELNAREHRVWFDVDELPASSDFTASIREQIDRSDVVVLVACRGFEVNHQISRELEHAQRLHRPILPVLVGATLDDVHLPPTLLRVQPLLIEGNPAYWDEGIEGLHSALAGLLRPETSMAAPTRQRPSAHPFLGLTFPSVALLMGLAFLAAMLATNVRRPGSAVTLPALSPALGQGLMLLGAGSLVLGSVVLVPVFLLQLLVATRIRRGLRKLINESAIERR